MKPNHLINYKITQPTKLQTYQPIIPSRALRSIGHHRTITRKAYPFFSAPKGQQALTHGQRPGHTTQTKYRRVAQKLPPRNQIIGETYDPVKNDLGVRLQGSTTEDAAALVA